jgi:hypothetical protein
MCCRRRLQVVDAPTGVVDSNGSHDMECEMKRSWIPALVAASLLMMTVAMPVA